MGPNGAPYCVRTDLAQYAPATVLAQATNAQLDQACLDATEEADSYLRGRYALPLLSWGSDLRRYTAWIAIYLVMTQIGFAPTSGSDRLFIERYYQAVGFPDRPGSGWFPGIQRQAIHPDVAPTVPQPGDPVHDLPQVITSPMRGWQQINARGKPVI
jgi:hypothetical protein